MERLTTYFENVIILCVVGSELVSVMVAIVEVRV